MAKKAKLSKEVKKEVEKIKQRKGMKQVILIREDLKLQKGKLAAQASHAAVEAEVTPPRSKVETWLNEGAKKVVLKIKDLDELKKYEKQARREKLVVAVIVDRGLTAVKPGTVTCMAIGPDDENKINKITGHLKIL